MFVVPLTHKGEVIKSALQKEYGKEAGERVLYAGKNKGTFTGIDALINAVGTLTDSVAALSGRADALERRCDDRRVIGGVGHKFSPRADTKSAEHSLVIEFDGDFDAAGLVQHLHRLGGIGASRDVIAMDENDKPVRFNWDGDGADKIRTAKLDGKSILK